MKNFNNFGMLASASFLAFAVAPAAFAQNAPADSASASDAAAGGEIIVTARRRAESLQDVPQTVNVVQGTAVEKLNITRFEDIKTLVPGLSLQSTGDGFTFRTSLRGVGYDSISSLPAPVEYYINDALVSPFSLYQSMYDIGQIEVLRGPQGTLRGRAAPAGQITVTSRRPDMNEVGGFVQTSATTESALNASGAVNVPVVPGVLAVRVAGVVDSNQNNHVHSLTGGINPYMDTQSGRLSIAFKPSDSFDAQVMYQYLHRTAATYGQVESLSLSRPVTAPGYGINTLITPADRLSVSDDPTLLKEKQHLVIGNANWRFAGQQLSYVGAWFQVIQSTRQPQDVANIFPGQSIYQRVPVDSYQASHELRLSSVERVLGIFDYTVGGVWVKNGNYGDLKITNPSVIAYNGGAPVGTPGLPLFITTADSEIHGPGFQRETSFFGNLTAHIDDKTELSGGVRHIHFREANELDLVSPPLVIQKYDRSYNATVYNFSVKHRFSDELMVYAATGSSWRKGASSIGVFRPTAGTGMDKFVNINPETSKNYEIGVKANLLDHTLTLDLAAYHQTFKGFLYRGNTAVPYVNLDFTTEVPVEKVGFFNPLANLPARVNGIELSANYHPNKHFYVDAQFALAKSKINGGQIACNPNADGSIPTVGQIKAASGGDIVAVCPIGSRLSTTPDWSLTLQSEYSRPVTSGSDAFVRGLLTVYPTNENDPSNPYDTVSSYALLNLYVGLRSPSGAWELSAFAKNLTNTQRVLSRGVSPLSTSALDYGLGFQSVNFNGNYTGISMTQPREFGLSLRYAFGSR